MTYKENITAILDKISAEIRQVANQERLHDGKWALGLRYAVNIIDKYKANEIHCTCTDVEITNSFIEDVEAVKDLLPHEMSDYPDMLNQFDNMTGSMNLHA